MKKLLVMLMGVAIFYSCEKESDAVQDEVNFSTKDASFSAEEAEVENKYFGVFLTNDLDLHGQIAIDLNEDRKYAAHVQLLNGKELFFDAQVDPLDENIVHFKSTAGVFSLDMTVKTDIRSRDFLVDSKEGHVRVYVQKNRGIPPPILFGFYEDFSDPAFTGAWDMLSFGGTDPVLGLPIIDDIIITHIPNGSMYFDETFGTLEPFVTPACAGVPLPSGASLIGGVTDGVIVSAIDQVATFNGVPATWTMHGFAFGDSVDPATCTPLPPGFNGAWSWDGRTGIITILSPPWGPPPTVVD